jgi:hypothetical protein
VIKQFFSSESRKAWVTGVVVALLQPIYVLLSGDGEITWRSLTVAVLSGLIAALVAYGTPNTEHDDWADIEENRDEPGAHAADR